MAGIYVHIPFCESKCIYCDFYSIAGRNGQLGHYVDCVLREAEMRKAELEETFMTLYVGGGTPSLLSSRQFSELVYGLRQTFNLTSLQEFTVEVNPDDVTLEWLEAIGDLGVNRLSMGIQSFHDDELKRINRRHTAQQAIEAVEAIGQAGIPNVSIDLIYGLPDQSLDAWRDNVIRAISLGVQHISAYNMMYEKGTRLWVMRQSGKVREVDEETSLSMYQVLVDLLKRSGYLHYEISNFALPGFQSKHNSSYWNLTPYLGLGAAAHSFDGAVRRYNPASLSDYMNSVSEGVLPFEQEEESEEECFDEYVMLRLRTAQGLSLTEVERRFGDKASTHVVEESLKHIAAGRLLRRGDVLKLTHSGVMLSDMVTRDLMW